MIVTRKKSDTAVHKKNLKIKVPARVAKPEVVESEEPEEVEVVEVEEEEVSGKQKAVVKNKRVRHRNRSFEELHEVVTQNLKIISESMKVTTRAVKSMLTAHKSAVTRSNHRTRSARTPSTLFDQALVDFFHKMLDPEDLVVTRNRGAETVDVSDLNVNTRLHRTDATQLYNKVFKKHGLSDPENGRLVMYKNSPDLVELLVSGDHKPEMQETLQQLKDGTYVLSIFNIQKFTTPHLFKAPVEESTD